MSYKKDQKLDNSKFIDEQKALAEAETIAKLAPNEKTRNEAKNVAEQLTESVEEKSTLQDQQEKELDKVLEETKKNINKTTNEAQTEVSRFVKAIGDSQEHAIQTTKAIGYELVHLQKEAISTQSAWMPYIERSYALCWTPWTSPKIISEGYSRMVDNFVDNAIATTNLVNTMFLANMETIRLMMDTTRDYFKLGTDAVKSFKETLTNPKIGN
jgi:prophage DNA circulation protein